MTSNVATRKLSVGKKPGCFVATYDGDATLQFEKSRQLHQIGQQSQLFVAPQPFRLSADHCEIEWDLLEGLRPLRKGLIGMDPDDRLQMAYQLGAALAAIHEQLQMSGDEYSPTAALDLVPSATRAHVASVVDRAERRNVHGDFTCANLFVNRQQKLVVIDPEPNVYLFARAAVSIRASIYVEVAQLVQSLWSNVTFSRFLHAGLPELSNALLAGYRAQSQQELEAETVYGLAAGIMLLYRNYRRKDGTETWRDRFVASVHRKKAARELARMGAGECRGA